MHGRLKVRSSAEELARKKKEQTQKVQAYGECMEKIFAKKMVAEYDEEMISLTTLILCRNPDVTTLWNIRRQCILKMKEKQLCDIFSKDLGFTETCLLSNPKSYCVWHHRCWLLENSPDLKWQQEVDVCSKYLKVDERNFHVWDYRRYAVEKAGISAKDELDFCTEKIQKNFSNYSSWHYRSKLLPKLYPHETDKSRAINEAILKDELEMVLTAAFTDPKDSSAWFYQRWLLGYSQPTLDIAAFKITNTHAIITFSRPIHFNNEKCSLTLDGNTNFEIKNFKPVGSSSQYSAIWLLEDSFELNSNCNESFQLEYLDEEGTLLNLRVSKINDCLFGIKMPKFGVQFGSIVVQELQNQLKNCLELLEYEPESKWTLLTSAFLMRAIDRNQYHSTCLQHLNLLKVVDPLRMGYYTDLSSKWCIEQILENWINANQYTAPIDLSALKLNTIYYEQYLCITDSIILKDSDTKKSRNIFSKCQVHIVE